MYVDDKSFVESPDYLDEIQAAYIAKSAYSRTAHAFVTNLNFLH
jgi:hypothetical protein